jgi:dolichyl-diphosphooligosaccharide--protein glycosyltransferase
MTKATKQGRLSGILGGVTSFRPRLSRRTALEASILGMVLVLAILFRIMKVRWGPYMDAFDPLFQLRVTEYVVENGYSAWFNWHDTLSWWPWGRNIPLTSFPGVPFSGAFVYQVVRALGFNLSVHDVCLYFPVLMAVITCIVIYFLGKDLGGSTVGLFSAFFMAISAAFIARTALGFYDTENIGLFGITATSLFFLRSIDKERPFRHKAAYAVAAGLSLGYIFASWGAARYAVGLLALFIIVSLVTRSFERQHLISYAVTMGVGFFIATLVPRLGVRYLSSMENAAVILLIILLVVYEVARERLEERQTVLLIGGLIVALVVGVFALEALGLIKPISGKFLKVIWPGSGLANPLSESVAEHKRSAWNSFFTTFGLTFPLAVLGAYFSIDKSGDRRVFCALFLATAVYFTGSMTRLSLILSIPTSLMAAYGLKELLAPFVEISRQKDEARGRRRRRAWLGVSRELGMIFAIFIFLGILPTIWGTADASLRPTSLASSGIPALFGDRYPQDWMQTLSWMKDNLPDDAVVVSWWDYGYWIEAIAGKTTLADGATTNSTQIGYIGRIMALNQSESVPMLEAYNATHIVVFNSFYPGDPQQMWPFGDNVKWDWMVKIGGLNHTKYYDPDNPSSYLGQTELGSESVIFKLMYMQPDPAFIPVFISDYSYVLVYEIDYDAA